MLKTKVIVLMLLAAGAVVAQVSIGVRINAPPRVRVLRAQPQRPVPDYSWIAGYWYQWDTATMATAAESPTTIAATAPEITTVTTIANSACRRPGRRDPGKSS